jgi:hypothetical protein
MKSAVVSARARTARPPGFVRPDLERLESRSAPGSLLGGSTLEGGLGLLAPDALGPVTALADLARAAQRPAVPAATSLSGSAPAPGPGLDAVGPAPHGPALPGVPAHGQATPVPQAPAGWDAQLLALNTFVGGVNAKAPGVPLEGGNQGPGSPPAPGPLGVEHVVNGNFAAGFIAWTVALPAGGFPDPNVNAPVAEFFTGNPSARLGTIGLTDMLTQMVPTVPGQGYTFSFDLSDPVGNLAGGHITQFVPMWNGVAQFLLVDAPPSVGLDHYAFMVTASSVKTPIQFMERHDPDYWYLTNVSVIGP